MMGLGWQELAIILLIVIVIFGAGKLPEIGSGLGKGIRGFKEESGMGQDVKDAKDAIEKGASETVSKLDTAVKATEEKVEEVVTRVEDI